MAELLRRYALASMLAMGGCSGGDVTDLPSLCSTTELEQALTTQLNTYVTDTDFSLLLTRSDGRDYEFERGDSHVDTLYESASTSKWVTAVVILRLVQQGSLSLEDHPQDHIDNWPITDSSDPLYGITLRELLSFTSGLESEPACLNLAQGNFSTCVNNIASTNAGKTVTHGSRFYYASTHLQVAGEMAVKATSKNNWGEVFAAFKTETGLFTQGIYDLPSSANPRLAGGMHWRGDEYQAFLQAFAAGTLLNQTLMDEMLKDQISGKTIQYSPVQETLQEDWHYGFGMWHECAAKSFNCTAGQRISSPGAYGAYPFWDREYGYVGILARQGKLGTYPQGINLLRDVQANIQRWANCQ